MEIRIHSFGSPESLDLRSIIEGMYRRAGDVRCVSFPDDNTILLTIDGQFDYENEYGIHRMIRTSPRSDNGQRSTSHVMVEINGKTRESIVCTYTFDPVPSVMNHITKKESKDIYGILSGHPLEMKINENVFLVPAFA